MPGTFPSPGEIIEFEILTAIPGQVGQNILHFFTQTTTTGGASLQEIAIAYDTRIAAAYKNVMAVEATYRGVGCTNTATPRSRQYISVGSAGVGSGGNGLLPTQTRALFSWYADAAKPRNRGRTYIPFISQASVDATGLPNVALLVQLNVLRPLLANPLAVNGAGGTGNYNLCITHRPPVAIGPSIVVTGITRTKFATQRRSGSFGRQNSPHF